MTIVRSGLLSFAALLRGCCLSGGKARSYKGWREIEKRENACNIEFLSTFILTLYSPFTSFPQNSLILAACFTVVIFQNCE